jgi:hypothetical protein
LGIGFDVSRRHGAANPKRFYVNARKASAKPSE